MRLSKWKKSARLNLERLETRAVPSVFTGFVAVPGGYAYKISWDGSQGVPGHTQDTTATLITSPLGGGDSGNVQFNVSWTDGSGAHTVFGSVSAGEIAAAAGISGTPFLGFQVVGNNGNDVIDAHLLTNYNATLAGGAGNDLLTGGAGNDSLDGGAGNDTLNGGPAGNDTLNGGPGNDLVIGNQNSTVITAAGDGNDVFDFSGATGNVKFDDSADTSTGDTIIGGPGNDTLVGGSGNDSILGAAGNDSLVGGPGNDILVGGAGTNTLQGGPGADTFDESGATAQDWIDYSEATTAVTVILNGNNSILSGDDANGDVIKNTPGGGVGIENIIGGSGGDTLIGDNNPNFIVDQLSKTADSTTILGQGGNDTIFSGGGNNQVSGGQGNDLIIALGGLLSPTALGAANTPNISNPASANPDTAAAGAAQNNLLGDAGADTIVGGPGSDSMFGGAGSDWLVEGTGTEDMQGGTGADSLFINAGGNNGANNGPLNLANTFESGGNAPADGAAGDSFMIFNVTKTLAAGSGGSAISFTILDPVAVARVNAYLRTLASVDQTDLFANPFNNLVYVFPTSPPAPPRA
jgi:Ca2+-binding RTX toxin-like protein